MTVVAASPALKTVRDVPILSTGIEYQLASGPTTFTEEDLSDAVASQDDPAISSPRGKIGHTDPRFDGEPALGKYINLRLSGDKQTVYADWVGVPAWLADISAAAYPNRSIEGLWEVETVTGHKWRLVITAVACLGIQWPGVSTLEDIQALYSNDGPANIEVIAVHREGGGEMATKVAASVNLEDVRRAYYDQLGPEQVWWWIRGILLDPNELIVDDDEGDLYRVPFTISGDGVQFGDSIAVKIEYVDAPKKEEKTAAATKLMERRFVAASFAAKAESRPDPSNDPKEDHMPPKKGTQAQTATVPELDLDTLRKDLGLADDASVEDINRALVARTQVTSDDDVKPADQTGQEGVEQTPTPGVAPADPNPTTQTDEHVSVDAATWQQTQAAIARFTEKEKRDAKQERDVTITAAVQAGKFPPHRREHYELLWGGDPTGTRDLIASLAPGLVPMGEVGALQGEEVTAGQPLYPETWLTPRERAVKAALENGHPVQHPAVQGEAPTILNGG